MIWKAIGRSVTGTSHIAIDKGCEDALAYKVVMDANGMDVLLCCASDGAGSAQYAAFASSYATGSMIDSLSNIITDCIAITEAAIYGVAEHIYDHLAKEAENRNVPLNEFSCTLLGCCIGKNRAVFFQVGDGAIARNDGSGYYTPVWLPQNGEYQNATTFLIDDPTFKDLHIMIVEEQVDEVAIFTDGLQMLALNMEAGTAHQPFFTDLFKYLRMADGEDKIKVLDRKLEEYLNGRAINERTDDDKTLFLASRHPI
jgi:hypothetical protein